MHDIESAVIVHEGEFEGSKFDPRWLRMVALEFRTPSPVEAKDVARDLRLDDENRLLRNEIRSGMRLLLRYVRFGANFDTCSKQRERANRCLSWLGWNSLAWHMRDFDAYVQNQDLPSKAPIAGFWDDDRLLDTAVAQQLDRTVFYLGSNVRLPNFSRWFNECGFNARCPAPVPEHHLLTYHFLNEESLAIFGEMFCHPNTLLLEPAEAASHWLADKWQKPSSPINVMAINDVDSDGIQIPESRIVEVLTNDSYKNGRYAFLLMHNLTKFDSVAIKFIHIGEKRVTVRRATFCIGIDDSCLPKFCTVWVFERHNSGKRRKSHSDVILSSVRRRLGFEDEEVFVA